MKAPRVTTLPHSSARKQVGLYLYISEDNDVLSVFETEAHIHGNEFLLIVRCVDEFSKGVREKLRLALAEGMKLDQLIILLKKLGVDVGTAEAVRSAILSDEEFSMVPLEVDPDIVFEHALDQSGAEADLAHISGHAARIRAEREAQGSGLRSGVDRPASWDEARAKVPGLRRWVEVKREGMARARPEGRSEREQFREVLISHLRDREHGVGYWAASGVDFPVGAFRHFDQSLRHDIGNPGQWEFPDDVRVVSGAMGRPVGSAGGTPDERKRGPYGPRVRQPTEEEVREARRILRRAERAAQR